MTGSSGSLTPISGGSNAVKLDVVSGGKDKAGTNRQNSLNKIVKFRPTQLKSFSSNISKTTDKRKEASQSRNTEQALVKKKIESIRAQNPFENKSPAEARSGAKINILT